MPGQKSWHDGVAGTVGGVSGLSIWFPLDTVKCRMQTRPAEYNNSSIKCFRQMIKIEGFFSLYRGLLSPALGFGAINSTVFGVNKFGTNFIKGKDKEYELTNVEKVGVGSFVGFCSSFVRTPIERVKTVMQIRNQDKTKAPYKNSLICAYRLFRTEGIHKGLYEGLDTTIYREVPQYMFYFIVYDSFRKILTPYLGDLPAQAIAGGTADAFSWLPPIFCIDVLKTKMQSAPRGTYKNVIDCARKSYAQEGHRVFFRGTTIALLRAFPLHGTIFVVYEQVMGILEGF